METFREFKILGNDFRAECDVHNRLWLEVSVVMFRFAPVVVAMTLLFPAAARADLISGYTVVGTGGTSSAIAGFSDDSFWWSDYRGTVSAASLVTDYGFNMTPGAPGYMQDSLSYHFGSLLLSSPFSLEEGDALNVSMTLLTGHVQGSLGQADVGFAVLLQDSTLRAVLSNTRGDGSSAIISWASHPTSWDLVGPSAGVITSIASHESGLTDVTLGDVTYGPSGMAGECAYPCGIDVTSIYTPGSGTYQLLFGILNMSGEADATRPAALAVKSVSVEEPATLALSSLSVPVPEPPTVALTIIALLGGVIFRRCRGNVVSPS